MAAQRVGIVQSYVPRYRVPFFSRLTKELANSGIECVVIAGEQSEWASARGHPAVRAEWLRLVGDPWEGSVGQRGPRFYGYGHARHWRDCDAVIMTHRGTDIDLNLELLRKYIGRRRVGVWGHLSRSVKAPNPLDLAVERWQMRRCDHIFAYTQQGADLAVAGGIPAEKVTAVMNSVEVEDLVAAYSALDETDVRNFVATHSLVPGKTFGYIGGIDFAKRIDFLSEVLDDIWSLDPEIKIVVAGRGNQQELLKPAVDRGQAVMLGYGGPAEKALLGKVSQALVNPGRVGLVAVDCLAIGLPILTTDWDYHAPEYDYLTSDRDVFTSRNDVRSFSRLIVQNISNDGAIRRHTSRSHPTLADMVQNFASGVRAMLV